MINKCMNLYYKYILITNDPHLMESSFSGGRKWNLHKTVLTISQLNQKSLIYYIYEHVNIIIYIYSIC